MVNFSRYARVAVGILGFGFIIIIHEFGHFIACKLFGVAVPVFSIGFGPTIAGITIKGTLFKIGLLPFGGYVSPAPDDLMKLSYLPHLIILSAGILMNVLFTLLSFMYLFRFHTQPIVAAIVPGSPAEKAGLRVEDTVIAIDGHAVGDDASVITRICSNGAGKTCLFTIERNGTHLEIPVTLTRHHQLFGKNVGWLGIRCKTIRSSQKTHQRLYSAAQSMRMMIKDMGRALSGIFKNRDGIAGPVGIINITSASIALGFDFFVFILGIISLNVALFNLLPIPFFDGGKILLLTLEKLSIPFPPAAVSFISTFFLITLLAFLVMITMRDIRSARK